MADEPTTLAALIEAQAEALADKLFLYMEDRVPTPGIGSPTKASFHGFDLPSRQSNAVATIDPEAQPSW